MGAITEIFRTFGPEYLARYPDMPIQHKKTVDAIINCLLAGQSPVQDLQGKI